ncbi:MAG: hypothetical protein COB20_15495 [SAR86 cluster bacterium]|uniref:MAPEG family protein n=1 Tax=SAR86 cluster bacterium TaxID=2030880 RepID=A0A2A4WVL9_9GAMM|nr:MAG: hypothetical protein COB20_15495 [SAR86 cluster bacterium]
MELIAIVIFIALIEYLVFGGFVGKARATYDIPAPATTGNEIFERYFRVHQNTLESLMVFIPSIIGFGLYVHTQVAAALGVLFIIGRVLYFRGYVKDPKSRAAGSAIGGLSLVALLLGALIGAVIGFL